MTRPLVKVIDGKKITQIVSELTGVPVGHTVEHRSGRVDAHARPETVTQKFDVLGISMDTFQRRMYDVLRSKGMTHEAAVLLLPKPLT